MLEVVKQKLIQPLITTVTQTEPCCHHEEIFVLPKCRQDLPSNREKKRGKNSFRQPEVEGCGSVRVKDVISGVRPPGSSPSLIT